MSKKFLPLLLSVSLLLAAGEVTATSRDTEIQLSDPGAAPLGTPFRVFAKVADPDGVDAVRLYFKAAHAQDFNYVNMALKDGEYVGRLPAAAAGTARIEQVILVKDGAGNISQSHFFDTSTSKAATASGSAASPVTVYSEVVPTPTDLDGFTGKYTIGAAPASQKYGIVAGLVKGDAARESGDKGNTGVEAKEKKTAGLSTPAIVGIAGGAVALIAIAANGGGGNDNSTGGASSAADSGAGDRSSGSGGAQTRHSSVRVGLAWHNTADVDLHVTDPCGHRIDHLLHSAVCQGYRGSLDHNANDEHRPNTTTSPSENIVWSKGAPKGHYSVRVRMQDNRGNGPTHVVLVVKIDGKTVNTISTTIGSTEGSSAYTSFNL